MNNKPRAIIHVDGDGFFASCEIALNPKLKGKPVVTGAERGIATAMSPEAKRLGVSRGMPVFQIRKLFPEVVVVNSDYHRYSIFAQRMYDIVRRFSDRVEEYSIDECFADITDLERSDLSYADIAKTIKETLERELGMTFSIGLAPTKVLAKVASKWSKPNGFTVIEPASIPNFLRELPVGKVWGIGPSTSLELLRHGVRTAHEFVEKPKVWVEERFSRPCVEIWHELRGELVYEAHYEEGDPQKSIQATRTFSPASSDENLLLSELSRNVEQAASRARLHGLAAKRLYYFLKTQEFRYHRMEIPLNSATQSPTAIFDEIMKTFDAVYKPGIFYRATGITLANLVPTKLLQKDLFGEVVKNQRKSDIFNTVDEIDRRYGSRTISLASSLKSNTNRKSHPKKHLIIPFMGETL